LHEEETMKARFAIATVIAALSLTVFADTTTFEGVVRSVDPEEFRVVVADDSGQVFVAIGSGTTPVRFEGSTYRIANLEVGDRVTLTFSGEGGTRRLEAIDVLESVSSFPHAAPPASLPRAEPSPRAGRRTTLTAVVGKVDQLHPNRNTIRVITDGGLSWVRIDTTNAQTPDGAAFNVSELRFGETIEATGSIADDGRLIATVIRRASQFPADAPPPFVVNEPDDMEEPEDADDFASLYAPRDIGWLDVVRFGGEVVSAPGSNQKLVVRNDVTGNHEEVWCDAGFVALVDDEPVAAADLAPGTRVTIQALRVSEGLVAQSVRADED
jgi:hypothetical protein